MHKSNKRVGSFIYRPLSLGNLQQKAQIKLRQLTSDEAQANFSEIMKGTPSIAKRDSSNTWIYHGHSNNESVINTAEFTHINVKKLYYYIIIMYYHIEQWNYTVFSTVLCNTRRKHLCFFLNDIRMLGGTERFLRALCVCVGCVSRVLICWHILAATILYFELYWSSNCDICK